MKNFEKYKTADGRAYAFMNFCNANSPCGKCQLNNVAATRPGCAFAWLDLEVEEEKPEPCYGCGRELTERDIAHKSEQVGEYSGWSIHCAQCGYRSPYAARKYEAIAAHNRTCRAVKAANKESEVK